MRFTAGVLLTLVLLAAADAPLRAQDQTCWAHWAGLGGPYRDLQTSLELTDTLSVRPAVARAGRELLNACTTLNRDADSTRADSRSLTIVVLPAAALAQFNSEYPRPQQDGLRSAGRGMSAGLSAGVAARWRAISAVVAPVLTLQQNDAFAFQAVQVPGLSRYGNYYHAGRIDLPRRFGPDAFTWTSLGQSFVRADAFGMAAGLSTENLGWGPSRRNPLLMSGAGPGFPHVFVGTSGPVDVRIGHLEVDAVWGRLTESEYFDTIPDNDKRLFAGLVVAFSPADAGITLGFARSYLRYIPPGGMDLVDQIIGPYTGVRDNPRGVDEGDNQLLSAFFRWTLPESGFQAYGEYAREDHWQDTKDLILELDHSRGYTVGLEKVFRWDAAPRMLRVMAEATTLAMSQTWQSGRPGVTFYTHSQIRQGYTHRGQLLGAPIGPGSDAQYVAADYLFGNAMAGLYVERVRYDNDAYYRHFAHLYDFRGHDAEMTVGVRGGATWRDVQFIGELAYSSRHNRDFVNLGAGLSQDTNVSLSFGAAWVPRLGRTFR